MSRATLYVGDALTVLRRLPAESVRCCLTSPPYWGLRDYGVADQAGLERTPEEYVAKMVEVFREVRRVLRGDGTLWLNLGDSYAANRSYQVPDTKWRDVGNSQASSVPVGLKPKDLIGIPWRVAFALQADGWWLRSDIIWTKPNPMPESVRDRPTRSHEYVFLFAKAERYYYDADAIAEPLADSSLARMAQPTFDGQSGGPKDPHSGNRSPRKALENLKRRTDKQRGHGRRHAGFNARWDESDAAGETAATRNARSVWTIATEPYAGAHFATMPTELARRCILAGSAPGDTVLDPFGGSGTVAVVAVGTGRDAIHIDLQPDYLELARQRIGPLLCGIAQLQSEHT